MLARDRVRKVLALHRTVVGLRMLQRSILKCALSALSPRSKQRNANDPPEVQPNGPVEAFMLCAVGMTRSAESSEPYVLICRMCTQTSAATAVVPH
jgi:hypothetical protein